MKFTRLHILSFALLVGFALFGTSCSKDEPTSAPANTFESVISSGGTYPVAVAKVDSTVTTDVTDPRTDGTYWNCTVRKFNVTSVPSDAQTFDPSTDVIYPGSLLQGASLGNDPPDPIIAKRSGGTVYISIVNGSQNVSVDVPEVKGSTIYQAMNTIIDANSGVVPANFQYRMQQVSSSSELALALNVSVATFGTKISGSLKLNHDESYYKYVVTLDQMMYVMNYDLPTSYSSVFAAGVTPSDLSRYIGPGNPATYISQVSFGRRFYLLIQSTSLRNEIESSIKATMNYCTKVSGSLDATYIHELENTQVDAFAQGGDASLALGAVVGGPDDLRAFLTEGANIRTGVPLRYRLRNLLDGKELAVKVAGNYDVKDCVLESYNVPDSLKIAWFRADTLVTKDASNVVSNWGDAFHKGNDAIRIGTTAAFNPTYQEAGGIKKIHFPRNVSYWNRYVVGSSCAFLFENRYYARQNLPGYYGEGLEFNGGSLVNNDYTIIAVVQATQAYFLTGSSSTSLTIGYGTPNLWCSSHKRPWNFGYSFDGAASVSNPNNYLQLFTMVYNSRDSLMRIFVNGSQRSEARGVAPLASFPDATFGAWCTNTDRDHCGSYPGMDVQDLSIAEVMIFQKALTADQRKLYEDNMTTKYSLPSMLAQ